MATIEKFREIVYSDETKFVRQDDRIELKEYTEDLLFYVPFDSTFNTKVSEGATAPTITGSCTTEDSGVFAQYGSLKNGSVKWDANNFVNLADEGCIKFRIRNDFINVPGQQDFTLTTNPNITTVPDLDATENKFGGASLNLLGSEEKRIEYDVDNISSMIQTGTINFFIKFNYTGSPVTNIGLIDIKNPADNNNRIVITHETDGRMYFKIYNQIGVEIVNINFSWAADTNWHNIELDFDLNSGATRSFIDGTQYGATSTATGSRINVTGSISIGSISTNISNQWMDDIAFFSSVKHTLSFTPRTIALSGAEANLIFYSKYDTSLNLNVGAGSLTYLSTTPSSSNYEFKLTVDGTLFGGGDTIISVSAVDTILSIRNKIETAITGSGAITEILPAGNIRIKAQVDGDEILIEEPDTGRSLLSLLGGVNPPEMANGPLTDVVFLDLYNGVNNNSRISLTHNTQSHLILKMYDTTGVLKINEDMGLWNNDNFTWFAFELNWNQTIAQFYIDGNLFKVLATGFQRDGEIPLTITSGTTDFYRFDELIIYNKYQHSQNYTVETLELPRYANTDPYIDILFGDGFKEGEVSDLNLLCSSGCNFVVKLANTWYYYISGAWRQSDGSYSQSIIPNVMETKFAELFFDETYDLTIRVYFHSDGETLVWLDEISIALEIGSETPAIITGTVDLTTPVNLSTDYNVVITTDLGSVEVDLSSASIDPTNVILDEIKTAIDNANIPGLAPASDDGNGHLVLTTENGGVDAFASITSGTINDALSVVWGYEATDTGEEPTGSYFDYSGIINWIRARLGEPISPVELTDEQIETGISSAVHWYNYYRNAKESYISVMLNGNAREGWEIPEEIGGENNIIEIIMKPRFPYTYYTGREDLLGNLYMQYFFHKYRSGYQDLLGDYYITISTEKDIGIVLGTYVKWEYLNGRLFIHPEPPPGMLVGIKFRSAITIEEINTNYYIRKYALGVAKEILGTIRATFSGTTPGGTEMLVLRGESLIQEGKEEKKEIIEQLMKLSEPLGWEIG